MAELAVSAAGGNALVRAAALLAVMGHPARLRVLDALHREGPLAAGALQGRTGLEPSALSHQLRILRDAQLVRVVPRGRHRIYMLDDPHVARLVEDALAHAAHDERDGQSSSSAGKAGTA